MSTAVKESLVPVFARHETFTVRYSWLKRGFDAVAEPWELKGQEGHEPGYYVFNDPDAHHLLGLGKNMARSARFWLQAYRLVEEFKEPGRRTAVGLPTEFGKALLATRDGFDPWLEDPGTWWLLHWMAISPGSLLPVWWSAFHTFAAVVFTPEQLLEHCALQAEATSAWNDPAPSAIKKDVLALLRAYAGTSGSRRGEKVDDWLDSPFVPLGLVRPEGDGMRFHTGPKPDLPPAVAAFACFDYLARTEASGRTALVGALAEEQGGPGRAFKLDEGDLAELLATCAEQHGDLLRISTTSGSATLNAGVTEPLDVLAARLLHRHFTNGNGAPEPTTPFPPSTASEQRIPA